MGAAGSGPQEGAGGFRVFKVNLGSPACEADLEVFFDFIVEIDGVQMGADQALFSNAIQGAENKRIKMTVFNVRSRQSREVFVTPRKWHGAGLLGAVVRYDSTDIENNQGIRVLDVFPNSPAQAAGLIAYKDYLLGTTEVMFRDVGELSRIVDGHMGKRVLIYVYNSDMEAIREVTITPRLDWGGEGAIGADIRSGLLHRIPAPRRPLGLAQEEPPALPAVEQPGGASMSNGTAPPQDPATELAMLQQKLAAMQAQRQAAQAAQAAPASAASVQQQHQQQQQQQQQHPAAELAMLQQKLAAKQAQRQAAEEQEAAQAVQAVQPAPLSAAAGELAMLQQKLAAKQAQRQAAQEAAATAPPMAVEPPVALATPMASAAPVTPVPPEVPSASVAPVPPEAPSASVAPAAPAGPAGLETVPLDAAQELAMLQQRLSKMQAKATAPPTATTTATPFAPVEPIAQSTPHATTQPEPMADVATQPEDSGPGVKAALARFQGGARGEPAIKKQVSPPGSGVQPSAAASANMQAPTEPAPEQAAPPVVEAQQVPHMALDDSDSEEVANHSLETGMTPGAHLRVPPTTPAHDLEALEMDPDVALQSPSVVNVSNVSGFMLASDLEAEDDEVLVPGVIFEVPVVVAS